MTIDGADNNDTTSSAARCRTFPGSDPRVSDRDEPFLFQIGRSGSSVINVITKSGTNELHGSGSVYFRDRELQALPATFDRSLGQTPPFDRQQYAFTLGGPIKTDARVLWFV